MREYGSLFRIRFIHGLQYRAAAAAGVATQFAWGAMELLMFRAFYQADPSVFPMTFPQLAAYIWLQQAFLALFMTWFLENDIFECITRGGVAYELARPMDLYAMWFVRNLASRAAKAILRCLPILAVAAFLPAPFALVPPADAGSFLLFVAALLLGTMTVVAFCMLIYIATVYTLSPMGIRIVALSLTEFLSGALVPLPFLPGPLRTVLEWLPFASMANLPLRIYSGNVAGGERGRGMLLQLFWLIVLIGAGRLWMKRALRRVVIQGG